MGLNADMSGFEMSPCVARSTSTLFMYNIPSPTNPPESSNFEMEWPTDVKWLTCVWVVLACVRSTRSGGRSTTRGWRSNGRRRQRREPRRRWKNTRGRKWKTNKGACESDTCVLTFNGNPILLHCCDGVGNAATRLSHPLQM